MGKRVNKKSKENECELQKSPNYFETSKKSDKSFAITTRSVTSALKLRWKNNKPDESFVRVTRSMSKRENISDEKNFRVVEVYRCMPLLGDEQNVPNWQVHIIKYSVELDNKFK